MSQKTKATSLRLQKSNKHFLSSWYSDFFFHQMNNQNLEMRSYIESMSEQIGHLQTLLYKKRCYKRSYIYLFSLDARGLRDGREAALRLQRPRGGNQFATIPQNTHPNLLSSFLGKKPTKQPLCWEQNDMKYYRQKSIDMKYDRRQSINMNACYAQARLAGTWSDTAKLCSTTQLCCVRSTLASLIAVYPRKQELLAYPGKKQSYSLKKALETQKLGNDSSARTRVRSLTQQSCVQGSTIESAHASSLTKQSFLDVDRSIVTDGQAEKIQTSWLKFNGINPLLFRKRVFDSCKSKTVAFKSNDRRVGLDLKDLSNTAFATAASVQVEQPHSFQKRVHAVAPLYLCEKVEDVLRSRSYDCINVYPMRVVEDTQSASFLAKEIGHLLRKAASFKQVQNQVLGECKASQTIKGARLSFSGRVGGRSKKAQKSRAHSIQWGETCLHVFSAKVSFASASCNTSFGKIGIKVWLCYR